MGLLSNKTAMFLLVILLTSATLFITPTQARAKADFDDDDGWDSSWEENEETDNSGNGGNVNTNADPKTVNAVPQEDHSHHHLLGASVLGSGPEAPKQFSEGVQNSNQAAFNESCSPTGKKCFNPDNLICSTTDGAGRCVCREGYVYVREMESCWVIPRSDQDPCGHDIQCHEGKWGRISRCNKGPGRCECYDYSSNGRTPTKLVDGVCYIQKDVGALCNTNEECNGPIPGEAYCLPGDHSSSGGQNFNGSCQCRDTHWWHNPLKECVLLATKPGDTCKVTEQCRKSSLGDNSRCETASATCKCGPPRANEEDVPEAVYYEQLKKCFLKKEYNDTCLEVDECRASLGPDVECSTTEDSPEEMICHCPRGKVCRNSAFSVGPTSGTWIISVAVIGVTLGMNGVRVGLTSRG